MISLSTSVFEGGSIALEENLSTYSKLGIKNYELSPHVSPVDVSVLKTLIAKYNVGISSLHNVCCNFNNLRSDIYGDYLASTDAEKRRYGVELLNATIGTARALGVKLVIVHAGVNEVASNDLGLNNLYRLIQNYRLCHNEEISIDELKDMFLRQQKNNLKTLEPYLENSIKSIREVCSNNDDIKIALENRCYHHCIPDFDSLHIILTEVGSANLGYWHDYGHGKILENIGLWKNRQWLDRYGEYCLGFHLHGVDGLSNDHVPPNKDNFNEYDIQDHIGPETLCVVELRSGTTPQNCFDAIRFLKKCLSI